MLQEPNKVEPGEIKSILEDSNTKVLLLIEGHDEYKPGSNTDIDEAIKKEKLASRGGRVDSVSAYCAGGLSTKSWQPTSATYVACREPDWLPC